MHKVEKAKIPDVPQIHQLINYHADKGEMLPRPLSELYESMRDFFVIREGKRVIGCAALHVAWADLAEIRSVAVADDIQRQGAGSILIEACLQEARDIEITTVFCLTDKPSFFENFGFRSVDRMQLPRKVWTECYRCAKFPDCDEVAMINEMGEKAKIV